MSSSFPAAPEPHPCSISCTSPGLYKASISTDAQYPSSRRDSPEAVPASYSEPTRQAGREGEAGTGGASDHLVDLIEEGFLAAHPFGLGKVDGSPSSG